MRWFWIYIICGCVWALYCCFGTKLLHRQWAKVVDDALAKEPQEIRTGVAIGHLLAVILWPAHIWFALWLRTPKGRQAIKDTLGLKDDKPK